MKFFRNCVCSVSSLLFCIISLQYVQSGPVLRPSRMVREIYPEVEQEIPDSSQTQVCLVGDSVYLSGEQVPSEQPCLRCVCTAPDVRCVAEACVPQPGCKAIHRPNQCCPDYQCECTFEGRQYANGERLPAAAASGACWACYCRGGEVQCAEVGCYTRADCPPRFIPGQCCPKYDHCPPRDPLSDRVSTASSPTLDSQSDLITSISISNTTLFETTSESLIDGSGDEELLNDEPKIRSSTPITFSIKEIESKTNSKRNDDQIVTKIDKGVQTDPEGRPQITIQEVLPPRTEYKITQKPQSTKETLITTSSPQESSNELLTDVETYASEKTEVYNHPPAVLRIGDQLLVIKQGQLVPEKDTVTPSPVITLIGAEGLQIGLGSEEVIDQEEPKKTKNSSEETTDSLEMNDTSIELFAQTTEISNKNLTVLSSTVEQVHSEYIPEENPYYPPIPEDIMILGQDEAITDVTSESSRKTTISSPFSTTNTIEDSFLDENNSKILPDVLEFRSNASIPKNQSGEWLKTFEEPTKLTIPLINEKAALPDFLLEMTAPTDFTSETDEDRSKEELLEFTTVQTLQDIPTEMTDKDLKSVDTDLVEILPGYEKATERIIQNHQKEEDMVKIPDPDSPKSEFEIINVSTEAATHVEMKDFHEEIQKRDVVKKVLKDTFDNPKENIQTDLVENATETVKINQNEEQNVVKPNDLLNRNTSSHQVVQKVNEDKPNIQESKETLNNSTLGALRDFFQKIHNVKEAD